MFPFCHVFQLCKLYHRVIKSHTPKRLSKGRILYSGHCFCRISWAGTCMEESIQETEARGSWVPNQTRSNRISGVARATYQDFCKCMCRCVYMHFTHMCSCTWTHMYMHTYTYVCMYVYTELLSTISGVQCSYYSSVKNDIKYLYLCIVHHWQQIQNHKLRIKRRHHKKFYFLIYEHNFKPIFN